jgi:uncharacterized protein (DUF427 family)
VWDYPRPPRLEEFRGSLRIDLGGVRVADSTRGWRVLETSHPPTYYLPFEAFVDGALRPTSGSSFCEWKGRASYFDLVGGERVASKVAWTYPEPTPGFEVLSGAVAVMAAQVDACWVDDERVVPQPGGFYGGWITSGVVGPFKGDPGTMGW